MKKTILFLFLILTSLIYAQTTNSKVSGTVEDAKGAAIPGVSISAGKNENTVTDFDGKFSLNVSNPKSNLKFSFIGFQTQSIAIPTNSFFKVVLLEAENELNEVIVVGYGSQRKKDVTGAISSVNVKEMMNIPTTNVSEMLRGRVSGVEVSIGSSRPGGDSNILIRGKRSLSGGNGPLFVVDGSPVNDINDLNANDIKSVEVLKDAASQAIYGARASAGVILVTTKRGLNGKTQIDVSLSTSIQTLKQNFELMNGDDWLSMRLAQQNDFRPLNQVEEHINRK